MKNKNFDTMEKITIPMREADRTIIKKCLIYGENERKPAPQTFYEKILVCLYDFVEILEEKNYFNEKGIDKV